MIFIHDLLNVALIDLILLVQSKLLLLKENQCFQHCSQQGDKIGRFFAKWATFGKLIVI
jgi:hypothetical protein